MEKMPYSKAVGSIMYTMVCSRLNMAYAVNVVSRFMVNPEYLHLEALKWVLRYLRGSTRVGLYRAMADISRPIVGYMDSNFAGNLDTRKSLTGYVITLYGVVISGCCGFIHN